MMQFILPFLGLCIAVLTLHNPLMSYLDRLIDQVANPKD